MESRIVYWTDTTSHTIERSDLKITDTEILVHDFLDQPGSIALDKGKGFVHTLIYCIEEIIAITKLNSEKCIYNISFSIMFQNNVLDSIRKESSHRAS